MCLILPVLLISAEYRRHIHGLFLLPADRPLFRRVNAAAFDADDAAKGRITYDVLKGYPKSRS